MKVDFILTAVVIVVVGPALIYTVIFGLGFVFGYVSITGDGYVMDVPWILQPDAHPPMRWPAR